MTNTEIPAPLEFISEARAWVADCDGDAWVDEQTDARIMGIIRNEYAGGWAGFVRDQNAGFDDM